jgi:hypothetical protein
MDIEKRAEDIIYAVSTLLPSAYNYNSSYSQIALQTTLTGSIGSYAPVKNGQIPYVQNISLVPSASSSNGTLLLVTYYYGPSQLSAYICVPTDQIYQIVYYPNGPNVPPPQ